MIRVLRLVFVLALGWAPRAAGAPNEQEIAALYARGLAGDGEAVNACISALEQTLQERPDDQLARVYLGSAYTLRSRDLSVLSGGKLAALHHGNALMDEAAAAVPNDSRVQLLRAITYEAFPTILGRRKVARQALDDLVAVVEKDPARLKPSDRQLLYLNAGEAAEKAGDNVRAKILWLRGEALKADPKLTNEIRAALKRFGK